MKQRGQAALEVKVGVFVFLLLVLLAAAIFLLGRKSNLFDEQADLRTSFLSASGLRIGAQVRLAGVQVGQVSAIRFPENPRDRYVVVDMKVRRDVLPRITTDSKASIDSMGLLGDKIIDLSVGVTGDPVSPGAFLKGVAPPEYASLLDGAREAIGKVQTLAASAADLVKRYTDPKLHDDVIATLRALRKAVDGVTQGKGLIGTLLFDKSAADDVRALVRGGRKALERFAIAGQAFAGAFGELGRMVKALRTAKGSTLNTLLLGKDQVSPILATVGRAADSLARLLGRAEGMLEQGMADSKGIFGLLKGEGLRELVENLRAASRSIRRVARSIEEGKGTLGGLLADPTIYEDIKQITGNLNRNRVLRSLIRFAIQRREQTPATPPPREQKTPSPGN